MLQVEQAAHLSPKARSVKFEDKIANLRDVADSPPSIGRSHAAKNISTGRSKSSIKFPTLQRAYCLYLWPSSLARNCLVEIGSVPGIKQRRPHRPHGVPD